MAQIGEENGTTQEFSFKQLVFPFYIPSTLAFLGLGMLIPILPLYAKSMGANIAGATSIVGLYGMGNFVFNIPAGFLNAHFNKKYVLLASVFFGTIFIALAAFTETPWLLGVLLFLFGSAHTTFIITRLAIFRSIVPMQYRGRSLAILGGQYRLGHFIGPIIGGFIAERLSFRMTLLLCSLLFGISFLIMLFSLSSSYSDEKKAEIKIRSFSNVGMILKEHYRIFSTAGIAIIILQLMRTARQVIVPLMGEAKGLPVSQIGIVFGLIFLLELLLFYPAGMIMDRWGRKFTAIPCFLFFALGFALLPVATGFLTLTLAALVTGIGNGVGSGLNMTLSTDFAPKKNIGEFIGVWRFVVDIGTTAGPFIVGAIAGAFTLGISSFVITSFGLAGAAIIHFLVPEPLKRKKSDGVQ
jgi:MFS family permease